MSEDHVMSQITTTSSRLVYENPWMQVREDDIRRPDGSAGRYGVVHKSDFALVVPMTDHGFYLVEQYRYPVRGRFWEFPQGSWEDRPDAEPAELARGELAEETGLRAGRLRQLGILHEAYGFCTQRAHIFLATDLITGDPARSPDEADMRCAHHTFAQFPSLVAQGRITDAISLAAYSLVLLERGFSLTG